MNKLERKWLEYEIASWSLIIIALILTIGANIAVNQSDVLVGVFCAIGAIPAYSFSLAISVEGYNRRFWKTVPGGLLENIDRVEAIDESGGESA